jgi:hypothetical protein
MALTGAATLFFRDAVSGDWLRRSVGLDASAGGIVALPAVVTSLNSREILARGKLSDLFEQKKRERATPRGPPLGFRERGLISF